MLYAIWEFLIILMESLFFIVLINKKLQRRNFHHSLLLQTITIIVFSIILYIMNCFNIPTVYTVSIIAILHYIFTIIFFSSYISGIFWTIIYSIYAIIAESIVLIIPVLLFHVDTNSIMTAGKIRIFFTSTYILVFSVLIFFTISLNTYSLWLKKSEKYIFIIISLLSIITEQIILSAIMLSDKSNSEKFMLMLTLIFILVFVIFFSLILYVYHLGLEKEKNRILMEEQLIHNLEKNQYEQIISSVNELRTMKHDIKNHIGTLLSLLSNKKYEKAISYITEYYSTLDTSHYTVSSGNTPFDCIIANKLSLAASYNITTTHTIHLPEHIPLNDIEVCSLISNLFDNAIESCNMIEDSKNRYINLLIKPFNHMLSITMKNSSYGVYSFNQKRQLKSTKYNNSKDSINHGIGLKRIQEITESNHGFIDINPENDFFQISILIPLTKPKED